MVCMMSKEQVAIFALLVTLTWACQLPEQCNLADVPAVNAKDLQGRWYVYKTSCIFPGNEDFDGYAVDIFVNKHKQGPTTVNTTKHMKFKNGTQICSMDSPVCTLDPQKASCITNHPYFKRVILAIDPEKYLVIWGHLKIAQVIDMTMLVIVVRDLNTVATVIAENEVLEKISQRCGKTVLSPDYFITMNSSSLQKC